MRALFSLAAVLFLFLFASGGVLAVRHGRFLNKLERSHAASELQLMGTLARESLIKRDYATVEQFLYSWGIDNADIVSLQAEAANGYAIARYEREVPALSTFTASRRIFHNGEPLITIRIVKDLEGIDRQMKRLLIQGAGVLAVFAAAMVAALWFTVRRTAILPREKLIREIQELNHRLEDRVAERTADLVQANTILRRIMEERQRAEEFVRRSKAELEAEERDVPARSEGRS